ncbi:MAG: class I SAM-dependent methyltransferase [Bacteroidetes bacterium]|nr:MAG: class I SAM-dependent methyltransferase [Bacteroidota bacterium]
MKQKKLYPESGVELTRFIARNYDFLLNTLSVGKYGKFLNKAIADLGIKPTDFIIDLGCGTGRNAAVMLNYLGETGKITGVDLSPIMQQQFEKRFEHENRVTFRQQRIDIPFELGEKADIVFVSFVIHGFPHDVRNVILENVKNHLKPGGIFAMLDFAEFDMQAMPALHRWIFKAVECPYAFDFVAKDWKKVLEPFSLEVVSEQHYLLRYVRLLEVKAGQ